MSATIGANDLKFVIFGAGHDYTLADSGDGGKMFFSHPFVPKGSKNYLGQYFITVPLYDDNDETVPPVTIDPIKDDLAHCTFAPAIGSSFSSAGDTTVNIHYYREYIYDESTIVVEKDLTQTITVVDHGTKELDGGTYGVPADYYPDGYVFVRPHNVNALDTGIDRDYYIENPSQYGVYTAITKVSSVPWRLKGLHFTDLGDLANISELQYADTSTIENMNGLFDTSNLTDISALATWDVSNVTNMHSLFGSYGSSITDFTPISKWDVSSVTDLGGALMWLDDLTAVTDWDVSSVTTLAYTFVNSDLDDLSPIAGWDVSSVTNMEGAFSATAITDLTPLANWDVSSVTNAVRMFNNAKKLKTLDGLENWDTSSLDSMGRMFISCSFLEDISALENWDVSHVYDMSYMFESVHALCDISALENWDISSLSHGLYHAFWTGAFYYSTDLNKDVYPSGGNHYVDYDGNVYVINDPSTLVPYTKDAQPLTSWNVTDTPATAFDTNWSNIPSWN